MDSRPHISLRELNRTLADQLLPVGDPPGRPVLLTCDDVAIRALTAVLGLKPLDVIISTLQREQPITASHGFTAAADAAERYAKAARPRLDPPPQLAALCLTVLAASRMDYSEDHTSGAYYKHLGDVLDVELRDQWPHFLEVDRLLESFDDLSDWMEDDQIGSRGRLLLGTDTARRYVGLPISQTVLRGRDRQLLTEFFWRYRTLLNAGHDRVRLLRSWSGRHQLTGPAQQRIADRCLRQSLNAALAAAYSSWNGQRTDAHGRDVRSASLRLGANPRQAAVSATVRGLANDLEVIGPDDAPFILAAEPRETVIPLEWLAHAQAGPLRVSTADGGQIIELFDSPTMLFALEDIGLCHVPVAPVGRPVWALTCDRQLTALQIPPPRVHRQALPVGWKLLVDLTADELPEGMIAPDQPDFGDRDEQAALLVGGLALGHGAWLLDHPPALVSQLPEPALLTIDGRQAGDLNPGQSTDLQTIANQPGVHLLELGDTWSAEIELSDRGPQEGIGSVSWDLGHPSLMRHSPLSRDHPLRGQGPTICGALLDNGPSINWQPPVLIRTHTTVHVIHANGQVSLHAPQPAAAWERYAGLEASSDVWGIDDDGSIVWVCIEHPTRPRVIHLRDSPVAADEDTLDTVWQFRKAVVVDQTTIKVAAVRWQAMLDLASEEDDD